MSSPKTKINPIKDIVSGIIMATTSIPQLIAYAESVGYSSYRGLSTGGLPLLVWSIITKHPYINCGITSATAIMIYNNLNTNSSNSLTYIEQYGESAYIELVSMYTLCVSIMLLLLSITGFGSYMSNYIPLHVRSGFRWGSSITVLLSALPNGLLLNGSIDLKYIIQQNTFYQLYIQSNTILIQYCPGLVSIIQCCIICFNQPILLHWNNLESIVMFVCGTIFIMYSCIQYCIYPINVLGTKIPGIEVIIVTILTALYSYNTNYTGGIVGTIPLVNNNNNNNSSTSDNSTSDSLPTYYLFYILPINFVLYDIKQIQILLPILIQQVSNGSILYFTLSIFMYSIVSYLSVVNLATTFELNDQIKWYPNYELFTLSCTNFMSSFIGSAPVGGSLSRSLVGRMTGMTSQLTNVITALCWIYIIPYVSHLLQPIPKAALSSIIVSAVLHGIVYPKDLIQLLSPSATVQQKNGSTTTSNTTENFTIVPAIVGWMTGIVTAITTPTQGFACGLVLHIVLTTISRIIITSKHQTPVEIKTTKEKLG